jgi:hypothetical protein
MLAPRATRLRTEDAPQATGARVRVKPHWASSSHPQASVSAPLAHTSPPWNLCKLPPPPPSPPALPRTQLLPESRTATNPATAV